MFDSIQSHYDKKLYPNQGKWVTWDGEFHQHFLHKDRKVFECGRRNKKARQPTMPNRYKKSFCIDCVHEVVKKMK